MHSYAYACKTGCLYHFGKHNSNYIHVANVCLFILSSTYLRT